MTDRDPEVDGANWRKSSFSNPENCVEVAHLANRVAVRDSKDPAGSILLFPAAEWSAFLAGAKHGEFDQT